MKKVLLALVALAGVVLIVLGVAVYNGYTPWHTHAFSDWEVTTAPGCETTGEETRACACGEEETREVAATGHNYSKWAATSPASCAKKGREKRICACGASETREIAATGAHVYGEWKVTTPATCVANGEEKRTCACGEQETRPVSAIGHTAGAEATCIKAQTCITCGAELAAAKGHSRVTDAAVNATCTATGLTEGVHCSTCGEILQAQLQTSVLPHTYDDVYDATCNVCGFVRDAACAHTNVTPIPGKPATCTESGLTAGSKCSQCGKILITQTIIYAPGHIYSAWMVITPASCTTKGEEMRTCSCGASNSHEIAATGHEYSNGICTRCGHAQNGKLNHQVFDEVYQDPIQNGDDYVLLQSYAQFTAYRTQYNMLNNSKLDCYDAAYFESNVLLIACMYKGMSANKYDAYGEVEADRYKVTIAYHRYDEPVAGLCVISWAWYAIEVPKSQLIGCNVLAVYYETTLEAEFPLDGTCDHALMVQSSIDPTCTEPGLIRYSCACGAMTKTETVPAKGHLRDVMEAVPPTCTEAGLTEGECCATCGKIFVAQERQDALGHQFGEWHEITANGCANKAYSFRICIRCRLVENDGEAGDDLHPHDFELQITEPTCTAGGEVKAVCVNCGIVGAHEVLSPLGHNLNWEFTTETHRYVCVRSGCDYSTAAEAHIESTASLCEDARCTICGYLMREGLEHLLATTYSTDAVGHWYVCTRTGCTYVSGYGVHTNKEAKCTDTTAICEVCGVRFVPEAHHHLGAWYTVSAPTCTVDGVMRADCIYCSGYYQTRSIPATGHSFGAWYVWQAATEAVNGLLRRDCSVCGHYETAVIPATGHHLGNWQISVAPTCTTAGEMRRDCTECNYYQTKTIAPLGHTCNRWHQLEAPTCTRSGRAYGYCNRCGAYVERTLFALGHHLTEPITVQSPTCTEAGSAYYYCTVCGMTFTETLPALGHDWGSYQRNSAHHWQECSRCSATTAKEAHYGGSNGCTAGARCAVCNYEYGTATGHAFSNSYSYDADSHYYRCLNGCGTRKSDEPHAFTVIAESVGSTDTGAQVIYTHTMYRYCATCGYKDVIKTVVGDEHYGVTILQAVEPTCTTPGYTWGAVCAVPDCGKVYVAREIIPALGHNYVGEVCTRCGDTVHTCVVDHTETTAPTCTTGGVTKYVCACGMVLRTETIPAKGHTEVIDAAVAATCTATGLTEGKHCYVCGTVLVAQEVIPALGHNYVNNVCTRCGDTETVQLPASKGLIFTSNGDGTCYVSGIGTCTDTDVLIPSVSPKGIVIGIVNYAFCDCYRLTSITIPDGVTSIGDGAFSGCRSLTSITIPDGVTSIGDGAFSGCRSLTSVTIGDGVTSIDYCAFQGCSNLTSVTIGDGVTSIGHDAFYDCNSLTSITIPNSVTSIDNNAFYNTGYYNTASNWENGVLYIGNHLIEVKTTISGSYSIKEGTKTIADCAFYDCSSLTSITIPDGVTAIGEYAFRGCSSLTSIIIPDGVTSIGSFAFYDCSSLTSVTIGDSVTSIGEYAFSYCSSLTSVTIGDGVTSIGYEAFYGCRSLTSIIIPNSVTSIGSFAFSGCWSLTSITIPDSVTSIGNSAFDGTEYSGNSSNWENGALYIGNHLIMGDEYAGRYQIKSGTKTIADYAFYDCHLTSITIPDSVTSIGSSAFYGCIGLESITVSARNTVYHSAGNCLIKTASKTLILGCKNSVIPTDGSVTSIGSSAFSYCSSLTSITIPNSVTSIVNYAFCDCYRLTSITIPDGVTSIGDGAFSGCRSLTSITIPDSVTSIGSSAFSDCWSLTSITIPDSVTSIGEYAFSGCSSLESITLPFVGATKNGISNTRIGYIFGGTSDTSLKTVVITGGTSIGAYAFSGCKRLTSITIPDSVTFIGFRAFQHCSSLTSVTIPNSVTSIGEYAFYDCSSLTSVTIPNSVTSIGEYAFYDCSSLTSVTIGNSVTSIGNDAFRGCSSLTSITIPDSVTSIGNDAFRGCSSLTSVTIGDGVTSIGYEAFSYCSSLTSITIPNSVTSIGEYAFSYCSSLTTVTIGNSVTSIGRSAFYYCSSLTSITIPDSVTSIGEYAFSGCSSLTSVIFQNASGWWFFTPSGNKKSVSVSNPATAAEYLADTYDSYDWKRS